jgi:predicted flap endonuclease-1-like 5' DNA nuclease
MKKELVKNQAAYQVTFNYNVVPEHPIDSVIVLGDFNEWSLEDGYELKPNKSGNFEGKFKIPAGRDYHFRYFVNGNRWANEKDADGFETSPLHPNIDNSVLSLPAVVEVIKIDARDMKKAGSAASPKPKAAPAKKTAAPAKKVALVKKDETKKEVVKTAAPTKAAAPVKKATPVKTAAPAKKAAPVKAAPAKKAAPVKAAAPAKKAAQAKAAPVKKAAPAKKDDLTKIEGIGPKIAELLNAAGINTFATLAATKKTIVSQVLANAGTKFIMHDPTSWAQQSKLADAGKWDQLKKLQDELKGGK